jgi:anti-sigma B factor antagonist
MQEPRVNLPVTNLTWVLERTSEAMLVRAVGEVGLATVPMLWSNLKAMLEDDLNVVVDLSGIENIDASGIQALLDIHRLFIQCGQRLVLAEPTPLFSTLLGEVTGLENAIPLFTSVAAAQASLRSPAVLSPGPIYGTVHAATGSLKPFREDVHRPRQ